MRKPDYCMAGLSKLHCAELLSLPLSPLCKRGRNLHVITVLIFRRKSFMFDKTSDNKVTERRIRGILSFFVHKTFDWMF